MLLRMLMHPNSELKLAEKSNMEKLFSPGDLNKEFDRQFLSKGWNAQSQINFCALMIPKLIKNF